MVTEQEVRKKLPTFLKNRKIERLSGLEKCYYCGCKSKFSITYAGIGGGGTHFICPAELKYHGLHADLVNKIERLMEEGHPKNYLADLKKEINEINSKFKNIPDLELLE